MQSTDVTELHSYNLLPSNPPQYPSQYNYTPTLHQSINRNIPSPFYHLQIGPPIQEFNPQTTYFNCNYSTCDETDDQLLMNLINERKQRRMISNRESARRSRMRKQKHLDELWAQVNCLRNENHLLLNKLNHVSDSRDQAIQENAQLKEETSGLRQMVTNMQLINGPNYPCLRVLDDEPCSGSSQNE
ncbi:basic leucine zipper 43-like [Lycium ferocissimum]|uniref:basic leucine zipper 43-like n=1 Tax=Lycium ferocissimum TaxID=112874 RepID=UPI002815CFE4|nr:basic leucine zipper 43-like [Lycium ferocissimum]